MTDSALLAVAASPGVADCGTGGAGELAQTLAEAVAIEADLVELVASRIARRTQRLDRRLVDTAAHRTQRTIFAAGARQQPCNQGAHREAADQHSERIGVDLLGCLFAGARIGV